jgi:subtilisin family serine protease
VVVAALDSGFALDNPAVAGALWTNLAEAEGIEGIDDDRNGRVDDVHGFDFSNEDADVSGTDHGTAVLGLMARDAPDIEGMALKVKDTGPATADAVKSAMAYAIRQGARVINLSIDLLSAGDEVARFIDDQSRLNPQVLFVASALNGVGNDGIGRDFREDEPGPFAQFGPSSRSLFARPLPNLVVVAASKRVGDHAEPAEYSNHGSPYVTVAAAGRQLIAGPANAHGPFVGDGTSFAAPAVSRVAALCLSRAPHLTGAQLKTLLVSTSDPSPAFDGWVEADGPINEAQALAEAARLGAGPA